MDGYTTTDRYPYGQSLSGEGSLADQFNYVRQLGQGHRGRLRGHGPPSTCRTRRTRIIKAYKEAFPDLFTDGSRMPAEIRGAPPVPGGPLQVAVGHVRPLPRDRDQAVLRRQRQRLVSPDPGSGRVSSDFVALAESASGAAPAAGSNTAPQAATSTGKRIDPYYLNIRLPGQQDPNTHFIVTVPFVPVSSGNSQTRSSRSSTADSDPGQ